MKNILLSLSCFFTLLNLVSAQQWQAVSVNTLPANFDFSSISVVNADVVWAIADSIYDGDLPVAITPVVLRTTDGGITWDYRSVSEAVGRFVHDIEGIDANTAIFTTNQFDNIDNRPIYKTTDGGLTWTQIVPPNASGGLVIHFFDSQNGLVINRHLVSTTNDGGNTWTQVPDANMPVWYTNEANLLYSAGNFAGFSGDKFWIGSSRGRVFRSIDRGLHWDVKQVAGSTDNITSIAFTDDLHGVLTATFNASTGAVYPISKLYITSDGGDTWTPAPGALMGEVAVLAAVPEAPNHYFAGSMVSANDEPSPLALNTNALAADAWQNLLDSFNLRCIDFISPTVGYAAGWSSAITDTITIDGELWNKNYIYKWTGNLTSTKEPRPQTELEGVRLFPNPVTDFINVTIDNPALGPLLSFTLTDATGRVLIRGKELPANGKLPIGQLPAGLYIVNMKFLHSAGAWKLIKP